MLLVVTFPPAAFLRNLSDTFQPPQTSSCTELIGMPYRLGGGDGHIDCIQMVYVALDHMDIPTPNFDV